MPAILRVGIFVGLLVLLDLYAYRGLRTITDGLAPQLRKTALVLWWATHLVFWIGLLVSTAIFWSGGRPSPDFMRFIGIGLILLYAPKIVFMIPLLLEDAYRLIRGGGVWALKQFGHVAPETPVMEGRRRFVSMLALGLASIPFAGIVHGVTIGKYNFTVRRRTLTFPDLPEELNGFTITQISDLHVGSFDDPAAVERGVRLINEQGSDVIVFTGDMVNNKAEEMAAWQPVFAKMKAPHGLYSVLGNHDYGDYVAWPSAEEKRKNLADLVQHHQKIGFRLLRNEHHVIEAKGAKLAIVGVENWGLPPFPQHGDLQKALENLPQDTFKVLLSHDPTHWEQEVLGHETHLPLTLSGHTHGMQFGIEVPGFRWSPVKFRYSRWADLYHEAGKYLYVNRGFGFLGFPGRVGIWPEITVLRLEKAKSDVQA